MKSFTLLVTPILVCAATKRGLGWAYLNPLEDIKKFNTTDLFQCNGIESLDPHITEWRLFDELDLEKSNMSP
ncbi:hypothetical protein K439DRAFT_1635180 [Ramaria rubella]|nr:hypothetical protein K439DRAFT_1635180 [Ramaria rubella]